MFYNNQSFNNTTSTEILIPSELNDYEKNFKSSIDKFRPVFDIIIVCLSLLSCFLNFFCLIVFKLSVSFKVKYNIYLICGLLLDFITNTANQFLYWTHKLSTNNSFKCLTSLFIHQPIIRFCFCLSITISLIISIDR